MIVKIIIKTIDQILEILLFVGMIVYLILSLRACFNETMPPPIPPILYLVIAWVFSIQLRLSLKEK
jgi:hypothetical protein